MTFRSLHLPLIAAIAVAFASGQARAQTGFPNSTATSRASACANEFAPLREEAEQRGRLIKAAADRHRPPVEACKLIANFGRAEVKMIKYLQSHAIQCGISAQLVEQLRSGHSRTDAMQVKICTLAQQKHAPAGPTGDFWPSSVALPPNGLSEPKGPTGDFWLSR